VTKQALVSYCIGNLRDEVLCDILPMDVSHLLLRRPWQFDKGATHNRITNTYSFKVKGHSYTLAPLLPSQVQPINKLGGEGNTSEKALFMSETWVKRSINNRKTMCVFCLLEK